MKKFMALVLSLLMIFQMTAFASDSSKEESKLLYTQAFNSTATNAQPIGLSLVGRGARVLDYGKGNKALAFFANSGVQMAEIEVSLEEKFFISFDIAATDSINGSLKLKDASGKSFAIINIDNSKICTHNNRAVAGISTKMTTVAIEGNAKTSSYNLYINGKCVKYDYYVLNPAVKTANKVNFEFTSDNEAVIYLDNINIGSGKLLKSFPVDKYDSVEVEYDDTTYGISDDVYLYLDFVEGKRTSAAFQHKNNTLARHTTETGEEVCLFKRETNADFHLDVNIASYHSDSIVYQFDLKLLSQATQMVVQIKSNTNNYFTQFNVSNGVLTAGSAKVTLPIGQWQTVSVVYNTLENTFDAYLNYKKISANNVVNHLYLPEEAMTWRIHVNRTSGGDDYFVVDNMVVYGGDAPRTGIEIPEQTELVIDPLMSALPGENRQKSALLGRVTYHPESGVIYNGTDKTIVKNTTINDVVMVPVDFFDKAFGIETKFDAQTGIVEIGNLKLKEGSFEMEGAKVSSKLDVAVSVQDSVAMVPLKNVVEKGLGKNVYQDLSVEQTPGMMVISEGDFVPPTGSDLQELSDFALYLRPDAQKITDDYNASPLKGVHPRYLADKEDFDRIRTLSTTDPTMIAWSKAIINQANGYVKDETPLIYELRDGVRLWYVSMDMVEEMSILGMAYQITGDKKYLDRAWIDLESVCTFTDWHPEHHIDVGGLAVGVAIGYDWLYNDLTTEQRELIEKGVYQNGFIDYVDGYQGRSQYMKSGVVNSANHNMVMNAGGTALGVAFMDVYPKESAYCISESIKCLEVAIPSYAPEGAWYEGMNYAMLTLEYMSYQLGALDTMFGTCYTLDDTQGVDKIVDYFLYMQSGLGSFCYADVASPNISVDPGVLWLAEHFNDYPAVATYHSSLGIPASPKAMIYYHPEHMNGSVNVGLDHLYQSLHVATMRDSWDLESQSVFAGIKGGRPADTHGHIDAGMFSFYANGTRWTTELSSENYNVANYWDNKTIDSARWSYYRTRAEAHSTVFINPGKSAEFDPQATAELVRYDSKPRGALAVLDMTDMHMKKATKAERAMMLTDDRRSLVLRDEIVLPTQSDVYWHMMTSHIAAVNQDGKSVKIMDKNNPNNYVDVEFVSNKDFTLTTTPCAPLPTSPTPAGMGDNTQNTTIRFVAKTFGELNITVKITPCTVEDGADVSAFDIPIADWYIPAGEVPEQPTLDTLSINGIPYSASQRISNYNVSENETVIPTVEATSALHDVSVKNATNFDEPTVITVSDKVNGRHSTYKVFFNKIPALPIDGLTERNIVKIEASEEPQPENPAVAAYDRNRNTRWSAEGSQYLILDLGHVTDFDKVVMSFMSGNARHYRLKMYVSVDGIEYKEVFNGQSGGKTEDYEVFDIGAQNARYVKIEGSGFSASNGTSKGLWNSWTEVAIAKAN